MRRLALAAVLTLAPALPLSAQLGALPLGPTDSATVAAVEAEGGTYPRDAVVPPYHFTWPAVYRERFGPPPRKLGGAARRCVRLPAQGMSVERNGAWVPTVRIRSGEFLVGAAYPEFVHGKRYKIPWMPADPQKGMTLLVRARLLATPSRTYRFRTSNVIPPVDRASEWGPWKVGFPSELRFPAAGDWVVVATSGRDWGCVILSVQ